VRRSVIVRILPLPLALSLLAAAVIPGCTRPDPEPCFNPGETIWLCKFAVTLFACDCMLEEEQTHWACATNADAASWDAEKVIQANMDVKQVRPMGCVDTHSRYPQVAEPEVTATGFCDPAPADGECVSCAKTSCCAEYSACAGDPNCVCWIDCLSSGNTVPICSLPEHCDSAEGVAEAAAACLDNTCQAQCPSLGSLGGASTSRSTGSRKRFDAEGSGAGDAPFAGGAP
jgi:hypothetical protein